MKIFNGLSSNDIKTLAFISLSIFIAGILLGFLAYKYLYKSHSESELQLAYDKINIYKDELNNINDRYQDIKRALNNLATSYDRLEKENYHLKNELASNSKSENSPHKKQGKELSPGFNICINKANTDFDLKDCYQNALTHWDKRLNSAYKKVIALCEKDSAPNKCAAMVKKMELGWINFHKIMGDFIYEGGLLGDGGTLDRVNGIAFLAEETKAQCARLENLIKD